MTRLTGEAIETREDGRKRVHALIGIGVRIVSGVTPAGWPEGEEFDEHPGDERRTVTDAAPGELEHPFGTVEVHGWWWDIRDVFIG